MHALTNAPALGVRIVLWSAATALVLWPGQDFAQEMDHSGMDMPAEKPVPATQPAGTGTPAGHGAAERSAPKAAPAADDAATGQGMGAKPGEAARSTDQSAMDHGAMGHAMPPAPTEPHEPIPALTEADRAAAFPPLHGGHTVHDNTIQSFMLLDRFEAWRAAPGTGLLWEGTGWIGTDLNRLWLRSGGEQVGGRLEDADVEALYGRAITPWWDLVAGIRHDFKPGASQDFAAVGVQGLAPYQFEAQATGYVGPSGQTAARFELAYDTLLTNRLILQPLIEANLYGQSDARRGLGSGLSTVEAGLRLRYEIRREFAPYLGVVHARAFGDTADFLRAEGQAVDDTRWVLGLRLWF